MTQLTYTVPTVGNPNSTEDPKIATALSQIQSVVNGNLDAGNMTTVLTGAVARPSRVVNTAYQPNTTRPTLVYLVVTGSLPSSPNMLIGATNPPTTSIDNNGLGRTFLVPAGWYYEYSVTGTTTIAVTEWTL